MCYRILAVLSQNRHVAQTMSSEPAMRAILVGELRRQVKGWNSGPSQGSGPASDEGKKEGEGGQQSSGDGRDEPVPGAASSGEGHGDSRPPPASIVVDPIHLTLTLETLRNVMRASRRRNSRRKAASEGSGAGVAGWGSEGTGDRTAPLEEGEDVPWPLRSLYGANNYYGGAGGDNGSYDAEAGVAFGEGPVGGGADDDHSWPLDRKLVADIAELMLSAASVRGTEAVRSFRPEFVF